MELTVLYRPVGQREYELIEASGFRRFPPRLSEQPFFYPVANEEYATQIARDWNAKDAASGYVGYVLRFQVRSEFLVIYPVRTVGGSVHQEYWIPAADLAHFNDQIEGLIESIACFRGEDPGGRFGEDPGGRSGGGRSGEEDPGEEDPGRKIRDSHHDSLFHTREDPTQGKIQGRSREDPGKIRDSHHNPLIQAKVRLMSDKFQVLPARPKRLPKLVTTRKLLTVRDLTANRLQAHAYNEIRSAGTVATNHSGAFFILGGEDPGRKIRDSHHDSLFHTKVQLMSSDKFRAPRLASEAERSCPKPSHNS